MKLKCFLLFILSTSAINSFAKDIKFNNHSGSYLGSQLGFNYSKVSLYVFDTSLSTDRHGTTTQEIYGGHFFKPNIAVEAGLGSYLSSFGLGARIGVKYYVPIKNKLNFSVQGGANYIYTILDNGFIGPYAGAGLEYSLNKNISLTINATEILSSARIGSNAEAIRGNFFSTFGGIAYYIT